MDIRDPEALNAQLKLAQLKGKTVRHELLWSPERQRIPAHHTRTHHSPQQTPLMKRDAGAREGGQFLCGHKVTGNKAGWVTVPGWSPENLTEIPHGSGNGVCTLCSGMPNRSGRALEENPRPLCTRSPCGPPCWDMTHFFCLFSSSWFLLCWFSSSTRVSSRSQVRWWHFLFSW